MQFEMIRLSLLPRSQMDIEEQFRDTQSLSREEWLRIVFGREITFVHRREQFHFVPDRDTPSDVMMIAGRIGRKTLMPDHLPPDQGLKDTMRESWAAAYVLIDPSHHDDGQKAAVQHEFVVGMPFALFSSLTAQINSRPWENPYSIEVSPIVDADTFWSFVDKHEGEVTCVAFEFIAPNMFGERDNYDREIRDMREKERIRRSKLQIENSDGLNLKTERVKKAVDYIAPGQGTIKAKTKRNQTYKSERKIKRVTVEEALLDRVATEDLLRTLIKRIFPQ